MSPQPTGIIRATTPAAALDPLIALDDLLSTVGLARAAAGGAVSIAGQDPILPSAHRLGACIGIPIMAAAVAAVAFHRHRGGPAQDLKLDLRQAIHGINPGAFWRPTLNGAPAPHPLVLDNPFLLTPYRTADGRWVMASGVYPHLAAKWCRFLDVPPDAAKVAAAIGQRDAYELEEAASTAGLPLEEASALEGLGRSYLQEGMSEEGAAHLRRALAIYQRIGAPGARRVKEVLQRYRVTPATSRSEGQ
jgi:crotonobetainyl-CoA:carnitine CoA-transferase CaiB-like acyl-CoA transferase